MYFEQETILNKLNGHSGCEILLCKNKEKNYVKKISNKEYNNRLEKQYNKQKNFFSNIIKTPQIYKSNCENGIFYYEMEYIPGVEFYNFVQNKSTKEISFFFDKILDFIYLNNELEIDYTKQIEQKIVDIQNKTEIKFHYFLDFCKDSNWKKLNCAYCHGDLTFENILVYDNQIYFIDFLDSFISSRLIDVSKLLQDIIIFWSYRNKAKQMPFVKHVKLLEMIKDRITKEEYDLSLKLLILNLLRIVPYSNNNDKEFLYSSLLYIKNKVIV